MRRATWLGLGSWERRYKENSEMNMKKQTFEKEV
jgi:hypothetical protein